jgi:hypothetical protein
VLADPARRTRPWHEAKWRALPDGGALTLGADAKLRWEAVDRPLFGIAGAEADSYLLHRVMLHADWRPNRHVQGFVQLAHHDSQGRSGFFPLDRGGLDLQQAFLELRGGAGERTQSLRLGRQEMAFSPRFVNPRDGVNIRSAYDGARGWVVRGAWRAEAFATRPVANGAGAFDDESDEGQTFSGARLQYGFGAKRAWRIAASVYRIDRDVARIGAVVGADDRRSWGLRVFGAQDGWDLDAEIYRQTGLFAGREIEAWAAERTRAGRRATCAGRRGWASGCCTGRATTIRGTGRRRPSSARFSAALLRRPAVAGAR